MATITTVSMLPVAPSVPVTSLAWPKAGKTQGQSKPGLESTKEGGAMRSYPLGGEGWEGRS